jgi:hypothetical protein
MIERSLVERTLVEWTLLEPDFGRQEFGRIYSVYDLLPNVIYLLLFIFVIYLCYLLKRVDK